MKRSLFPSRRNLHVLLGLLIVLTLALATVPFLGAHAQATNLALNKPVTFSGQQVGNEATHAVDGSANTRWAASPWPQWIQVDLGATYSISQTEMTPYLSRAYHGGLAEWHQLHNHR